MESKVFGTRLPCEYVERTGAYIIPIKDEKAAVVRTEKGLFLIGGGIDDGESDRQCIVRECMEETGCHAIPGELLCAAESYIEHSQTGHFHPIQRYYSGSITEPQTAADTEHELVWVSAETASENMYLEMQGWAIGQALKRAREKHS
ncbi:MAG: NUDIX domain-containing protein [Ruminococcaceae bacterium]|nr:NUDIX domain-containing protein [Oscillospiraceae bacterium]